jgi:hypothetical protein
MDFTFVLTRCLISTSHMIRIIPYSQAPNCLEVLDGMQTTFLSSGAGCRPSSIFGARLLVLMLLKCL